MKWKALRSFKEIGRWVGGGCGFVALVALGVAAAADNGGTTAQATKMGPPAPLLSKNGSALAVKVNRTVPRVRVTGIALPPSIPILLPPELSGTDIRLIWTAVSNTIYRVEFNPDLNPSNWNVLPGDVTGISNTASKLDPLTSSNRFYRVRVAP